MTDIPREYRRISLDGWYQTDEGDIYHLEGYYYVSTNNQYVLIQTTDINNVPWRRIIKVKPYNGNRQRKGEK